MLDQFVGKILLLRPAHEISIVLGCPCDHPSVRENDDFTSIGCIETHDHIAVTRKVFGKGGVVRRQGSESRSHKYHRI